VLLPRRSLSCLLRCAGPFPSRVISLAWCRSCSIERGLLTSRWAPKSWSWPIFSLRCQSKSSQVPKKVSTQTQLVNLLSFSCMVQRYDPPSWLQEEVWSFLRGLKTGVIGSKKQSWRGSTFSFSVQSVHSLRHNLLRPASWLLSRSGFFLFTG
jgi:hypothetical protein